MGHAQLDAVLKELKIAQVMKAKSHVPEIEFEGLALNC